jgi:hypothetical protein
MAVKVFKLINGEELIAKVTDTNDNGYVLDNPATIVVQQTEKGVGVALAPYMPYAIGKVQLNRCSISSEGDPETKMENEYSRIFGSGIQLASAGALAGL